MSSLASGVGSLFTGNMGDFTDALGFTDHQQEEQNYALAQQSQVYSQALTQTELDFQREQYADWNSIYGDLQEDLGTYFKNLTGDSRIAQQVMEVDRASQEAQRATDQQLAQRGLTGGGLEAASVMQNEYSSAAQKAAIRASADEQVAQQQLGFLGVGLNQGTEMLGVNAGVSNTGASLAGNMAGNYLGSSTDLTQAGLGNVTNKSMEVGSSISGMFSDIRLKDNIVELGTIKGINFYSWTWNEEANKRGYYGKSIGVLAQEIIIPMPEAVIEAGEYFKVDYNKVFEYIGDK